MLDTMNVIAIGLLAGVLTSCAGKDAAPQEETPVSDGDSVADAIDNCPLAANDDQNDVDGDGAGDACDATDDAPIYRVYRANTAGGAVQLMVHSSTNQITHVRAKPDDPQWFTATTYRLDLDGDGRAQETENGALNYAGTEVGTFKWNSADGAVSRDAVWNKVEGDVADAIHANSSWTADGNLIYLAQDTTVGIHRASFSPDPATPLMPEPVQVPAVFLAVADPDQFGDTGTGKIILHGTFESGGKYARALWSMPASGDDGTNTTLVSVSMCSGATPCLFDSLDAVLGGNDVRISPDGNEIVWMLQHPEDPTGTAYRLYHKNLTTGVETKLSAADLDPLEVEGLPAWSADGQQIVFDHFDVRNLIADGVMTMSLYTVNKDGTQRARIPLPENLCPSHPQFLPYTLGGVPAVLFHAWPCMKKASGKCGCNW